MITFATPEQWLKLPSLWKQCFEDGAYGDFIFSHLLTPDRVLVAQQDNEPVAILCFDPFELWTPSGKTTGAYIFGVGTLPAYRGNGLSTALLSYAHDTFQKTGYALSALVPASTDLFRFYAKRGYETTFSICRISSPADTESFNTKLEPADFAQLSDLRDRYFASSCQYVRWDTRYLSYIGREAAFLGGDVLAFGQGASRGYAVCYPHNKVVYIKELAACESDYPDVIRAICSYYKAERYEVRLPVDFHATGIKNCLPFAMTKWYDIEKSRALSIGCTAPGYIAHVLD